MRFVRFPVGDVGVWGVVEDDRVRPLSESPFGAFRSEADAKLLANADLLAPIKPSKIVAVSLPGAEIALIPPTARNGPGWETRLLSSDSQVELIPGIVAVIASPVESNHAFDQEHTVFGHSAGFLISERTIANEEGPGLKSYGYDGYLPIGPWLETDWQTDNRGVTVSAIKNVEPHGDAEPEPVNLFSGSTGSLDQAVIDAITNVTGIMSLDPGDALFVPLAAAVGSFATSFNVTMAVEGLGTLEMHLHSPFDDAGGPLGPKQPIGG
jgi:hypothetical protein